MYTAVYQMIDVIISSINRLNQTKAHANKSPILCAADDLSQAYDIYFTNFDLKDTKRIGHIKFLLHTPTMVVGHTQELYLPMNFTCHHPLVPFNSVRMEIYFKNNERLPQGRLDIKFFVDEYQDEEYLYESRDIFSDHTILRFSRPDIYFNGRFIRHVGTFSDPDCDYAYNAETVNLIELTYSIDIDRKIITSGGKRY